jgi:hypothetical protein
VITADSLRRALAKDPVDFSAVAIMVQLLGAPALPMVLDKLMAATEPEALQQFITMLKGLGEGESVGESALARVAGAPWPVQRNLLTLLAALPGVPAGFSPGEFTRNPDPAVRSVALKILLGGNSTGAGPSVMRSPGKTPRPSGWEICRGGRRLSPGGGAAPHPADRAGRLRAGVKAAGDSGHRAGQPSPGGGFPGGIEHDAFAVAPPQAAGHRSPQVLAAVTGLSRHWAQHPLAREFLNLARAHNEAEFRAAATGSIA